jgi:glycosyltransferase involved in cell wall biosynthesis
VGEAVVDGVTGLLVPPGHPGALADAVGSLFTRRGWAKQLGQAGRTIARERFRASHSVRLLEEAYERWWRDVARTGATQDARA